MRELRSRHDELNNLGRSFAELLERDFAPTAHELGLKRMKLSIAVKHYLVEEHASIIKPLSILGSTEAQDLIATFVKQTEDLRQAYSKHIGDWPPDRVQENWSGYRASSKRLTQEMARVARLKENTLFRKASEILERRPEQEES